MAKFKSDINLFDCIFKDKTKKAINLEKEIKKSVIVFGVIAVVVGGILGAFAAVKKVELEINNGKISDLKAQYNFDEIAERKAYRDKLQSDNVKIQEELANFEAEPQFKIELIDAIEEAQPENLKISSITYKDSNITLSCTGPEQLTGAQFANILHGKDELFSDVIYSGSRFEDPNWEFELIVVVRNKAQEEAEAAAKAAEAASETTTEEAK